MLLPATRGNADPGVVVEVVVLRLGVDGWTPLTVEWRFPAIGLTGELPETSRLRRKVPCLRLVPGGSGRGRPDDGVDRVFPRLAGEFKLVVYVLDREGILSPVRNSCLRASCGLRRRDGSQRRQREMKSRKASSSHFRTCLSSFELGRRRRPFEETVNLGLPKESKKSFFRVLFSIKCFSGGPKTSMIQASCSCSFSPGKMGYPVYSSARIHPRLHMSMGMPYDMPRMTSGER